MKQKFSFSSDAEMQALVQSIAEAQQALAEIREQIPELFSEERLAEQLRRANIAIAQQIEARKQKRRAWGGTLIRTFWLCLRSFGSVGISNEFPAPSGVRLEARSKAAVVELGRS
ncbi:hypothetical protein [Paraburkholderia humisilvae]|uniref:Uncharacterized protein n=1 Tax=Paraburkholderia humisilvae TaxID=627669 RepID=A0A6J5DDV8_9BURK|nr:hypothetical protein [Paraburkholderia humisilvae]CAB3752470.1 hypothetical protein LMG29542_01765 [Paraburkholderia humisilvae]